MKPVQTSPPDTVCTPRPLTTLPRLWPHLAPERQHHIAQCVAQLILRLHRTPQEPATQEPATQEASHEPPS